MSEWNLNVIKDEIRKLDPELNPDGHLFHTVVVLMAAALVIGPNTQRLANFTGCPSDMVAEISKRMRRAGLWENGEVKNDHWYEGDKWTVGIWTDALVAEGRMVTRLRKDGKREYRALTVGKSQ